MHLSGTEIIDFIIAMIGIMSSVYMLLSYLTSTRKDRVTATHMVFAAIFLLFYNICLGSLVLLEDYEGVLNDKNWALVLILMGFGTYLYAIITAYVVSRYIAFLLKPPEQVHKRIRVALTTMLVLFSAILFIAQYTGNLVQIDEAGIYSEGRLSFVGHIMVAFYLVFNLFLLIRFRQNVSVHQRRIFVLYIGLPILGIVVRQFVKDVYVAALSSNLSVSLFMILSMIEQAEEYRQQEIKNEQLKVDILLGQIQPHFLFNVLYVIQEICHIDAEQASEAISEFSKYLRHNMDSLSINRPIPFSDELEHTKHYVSLQQLRFGEALVVEYDLACTEFNMPTLTLQPIVENAVRYGVRKNSTGEGTVIIQTREHPNHYEVKVIDNGPGFDPNESKKDGISHMGLYNVKERLQRICGGKLEIWSELGKGTIVTMILPKKQ